MAGAARFTSRHSCRPLVQVSNVRAVHFLLTSGPPSRPGRYREWAGNFWLVAIVTMLCLALARTAFAAPVLPELTGRVVDGANLLSAADRAALDTQLEALESKSTDQIVVVTVPSLQDYPVEDFANALARKWGIGQKGKDNGILVLVAPKERKVRIEVGRKLEPLLPDGKAGTIIRETILPMFRRGDFAGGIKAGVQDIKSVLEGDDAELAERAKRPPPPVDYSGYIVLAIWLLIVIVVIRAQMRQAQFVANMTPDQRRRYQQQQQRDSGSVIVFPGGSGGWSGGSGGGGGGGFSGGGGDFGGGGASGDW